MKLQITTKNYKTYNTLLNLLINERIDIKPLQFTKYKRILNRLSKYKYIDLEIKDEKITINLYKEFYLYYKREKNNIYKHQSRGNNK